MTTLLHTTDDSKEILVNWDNVMYAELYSYASSVLTRLVFADKNTKYVQETLPKILELLQDAHMASTV